MSNKSDSASCGTGCTDLAQAAEGCTSDIPVQVNPATCGHKYNEEWCHPTTVCVEGGIFEGKPCEVPCPTETEICTCETEEVCPIHVTASLCYTVNGCKPHPCINSTPPKIGCIEVKAGAGQWDGGLPAWTKACLNGCDLEKEMHCNPWFTKYMIPQGQTTLDLDTNPNSTTNLMVNAGGVGRQINFREFMALSVKMYELGREISEGIDPNALTLGYVNSADGDLGLAIIHEGEAVGMPLALNTVVDIDTGEIVEVKLPLPMA